MWHPVKRRLPLLAKSMSGTMAIERANPKNPVPILHIHGTADRIVPYNGPTKNMPKFIKFKSVDETMAIWTKINRCDDKPTASTLEDKVDDGTTATRLAYPAKSGGAEVQLIRITNGGHIWPGRKSFSGFTGLSSKDFSANQLIWDFFKRKRLGSKG